MKSRKVLGDESQEKTVKEEWSAYQCDRDCKVATRMSLVCLGRQFQYNDGTEARLQRV